jgi:excisionase family DNA binding protein
VSTHSETVAPLPVEAHRPLVLTVEEAAHRLGVGRTVMYALVSSGAVESVRIGRLRRVPVDALTSFLEELRKVKTGPVA